MYRDGVQMIGDVIARNTLLQPQRKRKRQSENVTVWTWQDLPMKKRRRISRVIIREAAIRERCDGGVLAVIGLCIAAQQNRSAGSQAFVRPTS